MPVISLETKKVERVGGCVRAAWLHCVHVFLSCVRVYVA